MKRIAVNLRPERVDGVIAALRGLKLEATIYDVKGAGKEKERVTSGRGMGTTELAYTTRKLVATVVDGGRLDDVIDAIKGELAGKAGRVVIMVSPVDDLIEI
ncbi:P-II family nitrogen regulator [Nitrososphaera sp.]|uniref:P-II family nitrogen regulator n=1 Tax=Nitrososphaera sp. TaxID=1971748 RepID=UPI002ED773D2